MCNSIHFSCVGITLIWLSLKPIYPIVPGLATDRKGSALRRHRRAEGRRPAPTPSRQKACQVLAKRLEWKNVQPWRDMAERTAGQAGASMIVALAGGVGAAKFLRGLVAVMPPERLTIISNTGDDIELYGLHISPDIDIVAYTLSGLVDEERGWGIRGDTFDCLAMLQRYGEATWFNLGDRDLATHIWRTQRDRKSVV